MYVNEAAWFKRQKKRKEMLRKLLCMAGTLLMFIFFCACGICAWQKDESTVAEAAYTSNGNEQLSNKNVRTSAREFIKRESEAEKKEDTELQKPLIVIDPGHGGEDEGCSHLGAFEKDINLELGMMLKESLEALDYRVLLTREDDIKISLEERVSKANESEGDLFISIHQNASEELQVHGVETWYSKTSHEESERFAKLMQQYVTLYSKAKDRGIIESDTLYVIRECNMPSCLVEVGFLSNEREKEKLISREYKEKLVQGMTDAVALYFEPKKMYLTFDDGPSAENTMAVLDILKEKGIKATFFVVGENVERNPSVAKRIVEEGHTIGIHCYNHSYDVLYESAESFLEDFEKAKKAVFDVTGVEAWCYRFPGGSINTYNKEVYQDIIAEMSNRGYVYYDWNASLGDAVKKITPEEIIANAKESTLQRNKVVMLGHDIIYATTLCLEDLLAELPEYEFLPITQEVVPIQF